MRKTLVTMILVFLMLNLTGCQTNFVPERREIDRLQLVRVIGIDKSEKSPNGCMLTVASKKLKEEGQDSGGGGGQGGGGGDTGKALVLSAEGKTIFEAARNIQTHSDKTIFWGHSDYYLVGEEAAKENINKYIDFFTRDHELRVEAKIYIVKGSTAKDFIEESNKSDFYIADRLASLGKNVQLLSISEEMKIGDLMRLLDIHHSSVRIPCIYLANREGEGGKQISDIESYGYAIFKDLKLVGFISRDISRGVNIILNKVKSSAVVVKDPAGEDISLEIIQGGSEVIPHFNGNILEGVTLKIKVISNLDEIHSQMDVINEDTLKIMEAEQAEIIKSEVKKSLESVLELQSDCLEICTRIALKNPIKWHRIEDQWMQISGQLKYDVQVESKIERTYEIKEPSGYRGRE